MKKTTILLITAFIFSPIHSIFARSLTSQEIEQVEGIKALVQDVEQKSLKKIIAELEANPNTRTQLMIKDAMAKAYRDIVDEQKVRGADKKVWLYSMVNLNMAYLQFVGTKHKAKDTPLNMLIRNKLRGYLPSDIDDAPGFHQSVE